MTGVQTCALPILNMNQFAERFSDPFLRRAFPVIQYGLPDIPVLIHLNFLAWCSKNTMGWRKGGSLAFAKAIEARYLDLGGQVAYKQRVDKILVKDNQAIGVLLADGSEHFADVVISAADGHTTIFQMLEGKYINEILQNYYASGPERCDMSIHVSLGVTRDLSKEPHALAYFLDQPISIAGELVDRLDVEIFNFDETLSPSGKYVIKVLFGTKMAYWHQLKQDDVNQYKAEKQNIADVVIRCLEKRFPGLAEEIEMIDVATPSTIKRYTGNWQGIIAPWPPQGGRSEERRVG